MEDRSVSVAEEAYAALLDRIVDGRLEPGEPLSVPALSRSLGIGRSPVREAVQRLMHDGLAQGVHNRGAAIVRLGPQDVPEVFEVRERLEGLAARKAAENASENGIDELAKLAEKQRALVDLEASANEVMRLDVGFHRMLAELSGSPLLKGLLSELAVRTSLVVPSAWADLGQGRPILDEHDAIVEALRARDADAAEHAAVSHAHSVRGRLTGWLHQDL